MKIEGPPVSAALEVYRGRLLTAAGVGDDWVWFPVDDETTARVEFPDMIEYSDGYPRPMVKIPFRALDARLRRTVEGVWRGVAVSVHPSTEEGRVVLDLRGGDPKAAEAVGMEGDQHNGWWALADLAEVEIVKDELVERKNCGRG